MAEFIVAGIAPGLTPAGLTLSFKNAEGETREITLPAQHLASTLLQIESAAAQLHEMAKDRLHGYDPRIFEGMPALTCSKIDVGWGPNGVVLMVQTSNGMHFGLGMDPARATSLAQRIQGALADRLADPSKPS